MRSLDELIAALPEDRRAKVHAAARMLIDSELYRANVPKRNDGGFRFFNGARDWWLPAYRVTD